MYMSEHYITLHYTVVNLEEGHQIASYVNYLISFSTPMTV